MSTFRAPSRKPAFQPLGKRRQEDSRTRDDQDSHKQRVGGEGLSAVRDHEADPLAPAEHLADHHADQPERDALTDASQDERYRSRKSQRREDLPVRRTIRP